MRMQGRRGGETLTECARDEQGMKKGRDEKLRERYRDGVRYLANMESVAGSLKSRTTE